VLVLVYLAATASLALAFQSHLPGWGAIALGHVVGAVLVLRAGAAEPPRGRLLRLLRDFYPLPAMILFYLELSLLTRLTGSEMHDSWVIGLESRLFGFQPSQELHRMWPWWGLSQYLHAAYVSYYFIPLSLSLGLYWRRRWAAFQESLTTLLLAFFSCCLFFIAFPVAGPYHRFGAPDLGPLGGGIAGVAHFVIQRGSSVGTAFPSSHTAVAVAVWMAALRLSPKLFWLLWAVVPGLAAGTVYGGFHYALDTVVGAAWGVAAGLAGPKLHGFLAQRLPRSRGRPRVGLGTPLPKTRGGT
jgi:membrane-associated phospholipid phosphatase